MTRKEPVVVHSGNDQKSNRSLHGIRQTATAPQNSDIWQAMKPDSGSERFPLKELSEETEYCCSDQNEG
jgi:hypothetical protein